MMPLFVNLYTEVTATEPAARALTTCEVFARFDLDDMQRANLINDCERHGRHRITADAFVSVWNKGL